MAADLVPVEVGEVRDMPYPTDEDPDLHLPGVVVKDMGAKRFTLFTMTPEQGALLSAAQQGIRLTERPLTHDLVSGLLQALGATLERITITDQVKGAVLAQLNIRTVTGALVTVDCRPSDALIVGTRLGVPVFALDAVLRPSG